MGGELGTAVATRTFANTASEKQILFSSKTGQYVRLRALTEVNGNPWTAVAELNVLTSIWPLTEPSMLHRCNRRGGRIRQLHRHGQRSRQQHSLNLPVELRSWLRNCRLDGKGSRRGPIQHSGTTQSLLRLHRFVGSPILLFYLTARLS